ncbi:MAG TPA: extracellular solute-binding protein [Chthoniobacteraceae bacterium]|nr:extracellular solute-binding protein [Chthoniobacteraceae bacterium]
MKTAPARRFFWVILLANLLFVAAVSSTAQEAKVRLRVSNLPSLGETDAVHVASARAVSRFLELNPDVVLERAEGIRIDGLAQDVSTIMMIAGGIPPDVLMLKFRSFDSFVRQGMLAPLDGEVAAAAADGDDKLSRIPEQIRPVIERIGPDGRQHLYGLPMPFFVTGLYYNRELFRMAGLPQRTPKDWDELLEFARKIEALGPQYKGLLVNGGASASWELMNFIWSAGGDALTEVAPDEWRATFDTPQAVTAYEFYYQLVEGERLAARFTGTLTTQERQRAGMFFDNVGGGAISFDPELFAFGAVPAGPDGFRGAQINAWTLGIYSEIDDPRVRDAAWRYVSFMTGPEAERIRIATMVELGHAGQMNPITLRTHGYGEFLSLSPPGLEDEVREAIQHSKPEPYGKNCNLIYMEMTYPLDRILLSETIRKAWEAGDRGKVRAEIQKILSDAVRRTNERMIGYVPPGVMQWRRQVAAAVALGICAIFVAIGWNVTRFFTGEAAAQSRPLSHRGPAAWLCLFPALALMLVWHYVPLLRGTLMAFQDYQLILDSAFIGLDNFAIVLFDPTFWRSILATFHFAAYTLSFGFAIPVLLAYALHLIPRYKILYRTVYYLPAVMSATAIFFLWRELFSVDGPLNLALRLFGLEARRAWTEDPALAMLSCVVPGIWAGAGPGCLIYLAALKTIPEEQFEAAEIDGAGFLHKTTKIVLPHLRPLVFINFIGAIAAAFHGATNILIMTGGGPEGATEVASLKIFFEAFVRLRFGPATAMAWILGSMLIGVTALQLKRLGRMEFKTVR